MGLTPIRERTGAERSHVTQQLCLAKRSHNTQQPRQSKRSHVTHQPPIQALPCHLQVVEGRHMDESEDVGRGACRLFIPAEALCQSDRTIVNQSRALCHSDPCFVIPSLARNLVPAQHAARLAERCRFLTSLRCVRNDMVMRSQSHVIPSRQLSFQAEHAAIPSGACCHSERNKVSFQAQQSVIPSATKCHTKRIQMSFRAERGI